ncbi:hypothetical protein PR001_g16816 [Phytophthora rubi]|uniref:Uncharacterized protein n=1 Tax=Phytophthora rubi TaxID=129364 RepID=A0A6A3KKT8_9STRA|nr:hypothetical protein PR001_g16816 [Phytophthora rubi]
MKAQSVGGRLSRAQEKLLQQRLQLSKQRQQQAVIEAETEQWRTARDSESKVKYWWSFDAEDDATKQGTTSSSMTFDPCEMYEEKRRLMTKGAIGSESTSTKRCSMPAGSWKSLHVKKACSEYVAVRSSSKRMLEKHTSAADTCWEARSEVRGIQTKRYSAVGARRNLASKGRRGHARAAHSSRANRWLRASEASDGLFAGEGSLGNLPDSEH